jgi:hypothetical protein
VLDVDDAVAPAAVAQFGADVEQGIVAAHA